VTGFVVKEAQIQVLGDEMRSPSKTSVVSMPPYVREDDVEPGTLYTCCIFVTVACSMLQNAPICLLS